MPPQDAYLESQVLTADPMELVRLLYRAAGDAARSASAHLAAGRIAERSRQITKAHAILSQLSVSLDHARGGALSRSLAELYDYMQRRLLEANSFLMSTAKLFLFASSQAESSSLPVRAVFPR